jgi:hypothetical protein
MQRLRKSAVGALATLAASLKNITSSEPSGPGGNQSRNTFRVVATAGLAGILGLMIEPQMQAAWVPMGMHSTWPMTADYDRQNSQGYPCRIHMNGGVQPGSASQYTHKCAVGYGGKEVDSFTYDLWVDDWQPAANGNVPANAIPLGYETKWPSTTQVPRYACMALSPAGRLTSGKVAPDVGFCDFPWGGAEQHASNYYVLVDSALGLVESTGGPKLSVDPLNAGLTGYTGNYVLENLAQTGSFGNLLSLNGAVQTGINDDGNYLVFCSGYFYDGYHPGKGLQTIADSYRDFQGCNISFNGVEFPSVEPYIGLAQNWQGDYAGGYVPIDQAIPYNPSQFPGGLFQSAIIAGQEADGSHLYICAAYTGDLGPQLGDPPMDHMVGKVRPGLGGCSIGYNGQEMIFPTYNLLLETYTKPVS